MEDKNSKYKRYRLRHPERVKKCWNNWYKRNRDKRLEYHKEYRKKNKEKLIQKKREWDMKNRKKILKYRLKYVKDNYEKIRLYYKINKIRIKKRERLKGLDYKIKCIAHYSNNTFKCKFCGEKILEFLTIDHIVPIGRKNRISDIYTKLVKKDFPIGYQILCMNCNFKKSIKNYPRISWRRKYFIEAINHYSFSKNECKCCKSKDSDTLTIDHINGKGNEHIKKEKISSLSYYLVKNKFPKGYRVLCMQCNWSKGRFGYCPHKPNVKSEYYKSLQEVKNIYKVKYGIYNHTKINSSF